MSGDVSSRHSFSFQMHHYKIRLHRILIATIILVSLASCQFVKRQFSKDEDIVARVYDKYLYKTDLEALVPKGTPLRDSLELVRTFINNWISNQLLIKQAEDNLSSEQKDFTRQLDDYRNSLLLYAYESALVNQKLDTVVTDKQISDYYDANQANFQLRENIVKVIAMKIPADSAAALRTARVLLKPDSIPSVDRIERFCLNRTIDYLLSYDRWSTFSALLTKAPIQNYNEEAFLRNNRLIELNDKPFVYLVRFYDYMLKDGVSPLSFEREAIRSILLNERKATLLKEMQKSLIDKAQKSNDFEVYIH